jgi:hypothetical protein
LQRHRRTDAQDLDEQPLVETLIAVRPEAIYQARIALDAVNDATVAMPAPVMPSGGRGPMPNMSTGTRMTCRASAAM